MNIDSVKIKRIYPGSVNGLINWLEENFHDINEFIATFKMKDGTTMTVYDIYSYFNGCAINSIQTDVIHHLSHNDELILKEK
jgi:hypothetical protein